MPFARQVYQAVGHKLIYTLFNIHLLISIILYSFTSDLDHQRRKAIDIVSDESRALQAEEQNIYTEF